MGTLISDRFVIEEGINVIRKANLENAVPMKDMYGALMRQYQQVRTIGLQGKAQDYVKKVLQDSKFFCILVKLINQAISQSKTSDQQNANLSRVYNWYTKNLHKLHFAEQPPFRKKSATANSERAASTELGAPISSSSRKSSAAERTTQQERNTVLKLARPKSVTFRENKHIKEEDMEPVATESPENKSHEDSKSKHDTESVISDMHDRVLSVVEYRTPDYHLVDDSMYIDTVSSSNQGMMTSYTPTAASPVGRAFTPVVNEYIEQIQREVNKVQGHPSDLYPEYFTTQIIHAILNEDGEKKPLGKLDKSELGRELRVQSTHQFLNMTENYHPNKVKKFSSLQPRKDKKPRPKTSIPVTIATKQLQRQSSASLDKSLVIKDLIPAIDFASAELSYEKEAGVKAALNRPKTAIQTISSDRLTSSPVTVQETILPIEGSTSPTSCYSPSAVDWRGRVTPSYTHPESEQPEVFASHSYVQTSARLPARGRSAGNISGGFRPRTAPIEKITPDEKMKDRVPQAASNTLTEVDESTTKSLLNVITLKSDKKPKPTSYSFASSIGMFDQAYMEYLTSQYSVPPSSIYEYDTQSFEHKPIARDYQFNEEEEEMGRESPNPLTNREYISIIHSIQPDISKIRSKTKKTQQNIDRPQHSEVLVVAPMERLEEAGDGTEELSHLNIDDQDEDTDKSRSHQALVQSPMWSYTAYPTPAGGVLRVKSSPATRTYQQPNREEKKERPLTAISFDAPFNVANFEKPKVKPPRLISAKDKPKPLVQPISSAPSIPSMFGSYGTRSPRRNQPYSKEHEHSAHKQMNPQEYLRKVDSMRTEEMYVDVNVASVSSLSNVLDVRPISSKSDPSLNDLTVYNAIRLQKPDPRLGENSCMDQSSPTRPKSSISRPQSGRPIPQYMKADHWQKTDAETQLMRQASAAVSIQKIFRGYINRKVYLKLRKEYREEQENKRVSAITIQRSWRQHRTRLNSIYKKPQTRPETLEWAREFKKAQTVANAHRKQKRSSEAALVKEHSKEFTGRISVVGPHVEVYAAYHPPKTGYPKKEQNQAAIMIQKHVRGMLTRIYLERVKKKAKDHSTTWPEWVKYYKNFLRRILIRRGETKPSIEINLEQMQRFMAKKKRYEDVFNRRAFGGELDEDELNHFFKECDLMPANHEVEHAMDLVFKAKPRGKRTTLTKREVLDIVFEIYKPEGTGIFNDRRSTWLHPIVDGEDAMKLLGSDLVEPAPLGPCIKLVAQSMKERREKKEEEERLRLLAETQGNTTPKSSSDPSEVVNAENHTEGRQPQIFSSEPLYIPKK